MKLIIRRHILLIASNYQNKILIVKTKRNKFNKITDYVKQKIRIKTVRSKIRKQHSRKHTTKIVLIYRKSYILFNYKLSFPK